MTSPRMRVVLLIASGSLLVAAACESSSEPSGPGIGFDAGSSGGFDAAATDAASAADAGDVFEGVWQGTQAGATVAIANVGGCSYVTTSVGGTVCDECVGSYGAADAGVSSAVVVCSPKSACSVSAAHTSAGTFTRNGTTLTFFYDYGGGTASVDAELTPTAPPDVCKVVDAGGG